jgi:hypothetical protein
VIRCTSSAPPLYRCDALLICCCLRDGATSAFAARSTTTLSTSGFFSRVHVGDVLTWRRFVQLVRKHHPHCLLHFEDFGVSNAQRLLSLYRDKHAVFNDDM